MDSITIRNTQDAWNNDYSLHWHEWKKKPQWRGGNDDTVAPMKGSHDDWDGQG